jgi:hypothetical protein
MKDWLASFLAQRSEAVHATNVVYAIHLDFPFCLEDSDSFCTTGGVSSASLAEFGTPVSSGAKKGRAFFVRWHATGETYGFSHRLCRRCSLRSGVVSEVCSALRAAYSIGGVSVAISHAADQLRVGISPR